MEDHKQFKHFSKLSPLIDSFGRVHTSLRLSVTDRCNIRCTYCMPESNPVFFPKDQLLTFEEMARVCTLLIERCGIRDIRITGGEPLVRKDLAKFIQLISVIPHLQDLSLTTNGILLTENAHALSRAGLKRLNISLDTLSEDVFQRITRRAGLDRTLRGIETAISAGFDSIKLNALAIRGITEFEVCDLVQYASENGLLIRFIEYMPLDADQNWRRNNVLDGDELLSILGKKFGSIEPIPREDPAQPAEAFLVGEHRVGIIRSVTHPFCNQCNRLRITADGAIRNCLFAKDETYFKSQLREGISDDDLIKIIQSCVSAKAKSHGINHASFQPPDRPMYAIGG